MRYAHIRIAAWVVLGAAGGGLGCGSSTATTDVHPGEPGIASTLPVPTDSTLVFFARTEDGLSIAVEWGLPTVAGPAPLVVMGHQFERDRHSWDELAAALREAGWATATLDHRGFGESVREAASPSDLTSVQQANLPQDWFSVVQALEDHPRIDGSRLILAASGLSVDGAVSVAEHNTNVRALVLLPGLIDTARRDFLLESPDLPLLLVAAEREARGLHLVRQYAARFTGPAQEYLEFPVTETDPADWIGTDGLTPETGLVDAILWFLERTREGMIDE